MIDVEKGTSCKQDLHVVAAWWRHKVSKYPDKMGVFGEISNYARLLPTFREVNINTNCNISSMIDDFHSYPDAFTKALAEEGLLTYSNPVSNVPVLSVCHGFLNTELVAIGNQTYQDEMRYRKSIQHLPQDKHESYLRLFSAQYPLEPLVDGLPGSVWLDCVEPTLSILKALNALKRRKSNLSLRKCSMESFDSNAASHGDFEHFPFLLNHFFLDQHHRLMRLQFLALEGPQSDQSANNRNRFHERQDARYPLLPTLRITETQRRRHLRQYRPYETRRNFPRGSRDSENSNEL